MADNEKIFVHTSVRMTDVDLFLQGNPPENIIFEFFTDKETLAHLIQKAGLFPSVSQAKKNGWDKPIPKGFSHFVVGKKKFNIYVLNQLSE